MSAAVAGWLQGGLLVLALAVVHRPLGDYMARVFTAPTHWRVEKAVYRAVGVDADSDQRWPTYVRSVLAFSVVGVLVLYGLQRLQAVLPLSNDMAGVEPGSAWNTAISFVTNTNWQGYSGESTMGHLVQMAGLAVQNFVSAAAGIAVAIAVMRGFARTRTDRLGNFWVDLTRRHPRSCCRSRSSVPSCSCSAGSCRTSPRAPRSTTLAGAASSSPAGRSPPRKSIKELGTNGGGFYNANSAHPFEGPTAWVSLFQIFLILLLPFALPRTFGRMVGDKRQGYAILGVMATLAVASTALVSWFESHAGGSATAVAGAAMEGKETRFGEPLSALFGAATTLTSTGAVNSMHDSYTPLGGGVVLLNMMLGEVAPGGVGSGLYGMLVLAVIAVFVAGLMVGRTPEYLGKRIGGAGDEPGLAVPGRHPGDRAHRYRGSDGGAAGRESMLNAGPHGFSEVLYAFTSAGNNNGRRSPACRPTRPSTTRRWGLRCVRPVRADRARPCAGRAVGRAGPHRGHGGHFPDAPPAVRRAAHRGDSRRRRSHLFPGARAGSAR